MSAITTSPPPPPAIVPPLPVRRFTVFEVYTDPTGPDAAPVYRAHQDYREGDLIPFVVDGRDLGPIPAQELLP